MPTQGESQWVCLIRLIRRVCFFKMSSFSTRRTTDAKDDKMLLKTVASNRAPIADT